MRVGLRLRFGVYSFLRYMLRFGDNLSRLSRLENDILARLRVVMTAQMRLRRAGVRS